MRIRTTEKLSEHREMTPEGYLLCKGAALARTGVYHYAPEDVESEIMEGSNATEALLYRDEKEVFDPAAMSSFEGKPLTIDHPDCDVEPGNWKELAKGSILNVRRGTGNESDLLLADILVTDAEAIEMIEDGLCELSCGYDTRLEKLKPGMGKQTQIRGNHVALVEKGRAGSRCRIKDMEEKMAKKQKGFSLLDKMRKLLKDAEEEQKQAETEETQTATDNTDLAADIQEMKLMLKTLVEAVMPAAKSDGEQTEDSETANDEENSETDNDPANDAGCTETDEEPRDEEQAEKAKDSLSGKLCDAATVGRAKRLGLSGASVNDSAGSVMRAALGMAMRDSETAGICSDILGGIPLAKAPIQNVRAAFLAVSAIRDAGRNTRTADSLTGSAGKGKGPVTAAQINEMNRKYYGGK